MAGSVLQRKSPFKITELSFCSKFDWGSRYLNYLQENWSLDLFYEVFFLQRLLCISINLPYEIAWNVFVMPGPVHRTVGPSIAASLEPLVYHPNAASLIVVSNTFLLVYFAYLKRALVKQGKMFFISLRKLFSFLR